MSRLKIFFQAVVIFCVFMPDISLAETSQTSSGYYKRLRTIFGPVHVWKPPKYNHLTAGTVIFLHGYYIDADRAWKQFNLQKKFQKSNLNAVFIVPEVPSHWEVDVQWKNLKMLRKILNGNGIKLPSGKMSVMGHSGAYRTILSWIRNAGKIDEIILLDALYLGYKTFSGWVKNNKLSRLIVVGEITNKNSLILMKQIPKYRYRTDIPEENENFTTIEKNSGVLFMKSQYSHNALVENMLVIPKLLSISRVRHLR
ncbi:MAG: hypothetical protein JXR95_06580 [Deltaproteobacteria bacterium]|nr:hypothetical protein [Deltaproteobacteria bacterium]